MKQSFRQALAVGILALGFLLFTCTSSPLPIPNPLRGTQVALPSSFAPATAATAIFAPTPTPFDTGWVAATAGLDRRVVAVPLPALGFAERLILFRINPARFTFRVQYAPGFPRFVSDWYAGAAAQLVFNAGYFDENNAALGLLVSEGNSFGQSYVGMGGMFGVDERGRPTIRSLAAQPYQPGEALAQAVQGFPMLIYPDGSPFAKEDNSRARRTALGQDAVGRVLLIVAPHAAFTLAELAAWLRAADLGLVVAFNLDGGGSTGYYAGPNDGVDSFTPVPAVVAVYAK